MLAITDAGVEQMMRDADVEEGKWLNEDPSLDEIQHLVGNVNGSD